MEVTKEQLIKALEYYGYKFARGNAGKEGHMYCENIINNAIFPREININFLLKLLNKIPERKEDKHNWQFISETEEPSNYLPRPIFAKFVCECSKPIDKPETIGDYLNPPIVNKELEDKLNELFPKERINNDTDVINEIESIFSDEFDVNGDYLEGFFPKIKEVIKDIQKESGRDRALVLFALAQKRINELEGKVKELNEHNRHAGF